MDAKPIRLLFVEDDVTMAEFLGESLQRPAGDRLELVHVVRLDEAAEQLKSSSFDVALLDLNLPDSQGLASFRSLRGASPSLPIVVLTGNDDADVALDAVREGAQDYLIKGKVDGAMLWRGLRYAIERKRVEETLREREEFFRLISDNMHDLIAVLNREGKRLYNSPSYKGLFGDPDRMRGTLSFAEIHPDDRERLKHIFQETVASGVGQRTEYRFLMRDGSIRYVDSQGSVIKDANGEVNKVVVVSRDITHRKLTELALRDSEQRYKRLLDSTTDYFYTVTVENGRAVSTSHGPGCVAVTGYTTDDYAADSNLWYNMVHEEDRPAVLEQAAKALRGETPPPLEHRIRHKNGSLRWVKNTPVPRKTPQGEAISYDGLVSDITARRSAEEQMRQSEALYHSLVESLPQNILRKDTEGRFTFVNHRFARALGKPPEEIIGKTDYDFYPRELAEKYRADDRTMMASGKLLDTVEENCTPAGERVFVHVVKTPIYDAAGRTAGIQGIFWDITERKQAEMRLGVQYGVARALADSATLEEAAPHIIQAVCENLGWDLGAIWSLDRPTNSLRCLSIWHQQAIAAREFEGFSKKISLSPGVGLPGRIWASGKPAWIREVARDANFPRAPLAARCGLHSAFGFPIRLGADVMGVIEFFSREIRQPDAALLHFFDAVGSQVGQFVERKRAEEMIKQANVDLANSQQALLKALADLTKSHEDLKSTQLQLIQAEKMDSVGTLAAGVAHEVKNPLQIILAGARYLTSRLVEQDADVQTVLNDIRHAVGRADKIVRGLLEFSASSQLTLQEEDLNAIIEQSVQFVNFEFTRGHIQPIKELSPALPLLKLDRTKLEQVFINLFVNATHAMPGGGSLTVRTRTDRIIQPEQSRPGGGTTVFRKGDPVVVATIDDSGTGIPVDKLQKIFDPFFTTKPIGKGTGLGLTVVKNIIELHGGTISIANRAEGGARVTITLKTEPRKEP